MAIDKDKYRRTRHSVHKIQFHFVWIPKRRASVLKGDVANRLREVFAGVADDKDWTIIRLAVQPDHVHLFVETDTRHAPYQIAHAFKGRSSRVLRDEFPHLLKLPSLWTRAYFCATVAEVSAETIKTYIEAQS